MAREEQCDGWYLEELSPGLLWYVTRDNWDENENETRPLYYGDVQLDKRLSCEHRQWYLARWTPTPDDVFVSSIVPEELPYPAINTFMLPGRFESVDDAVGAVVLANHWTHWTNKGGST